MGGSYYPVITCPEGGKRLLERIVKQDLVCNWCARRVEFAEVGCGPDE